MSKYTTELRFICEYYAGVDEQKGLGDVNAIIQAAIPKLFSFDFPMYDEQYRNVLCTKIIKHYYTREIGEEVLGLWKLRLDTKLNEIMPYYNKLYQSGLNDFNPLFDTQLKTVYGGQKSGADSENENIDEKEKVDTTEKENLERESKEAGTTASDRTSGGGSTQSDSQDDDDDVTRTDKYSDTPQGGLDGVIAGDYLTNARIVDETTHRHTGAERRGSWNENVDESGSYKDDTTVSEDRDRTKSDDISRDINRQKNGTSKSTEDYILNVAGRTGGDVAKRITELKNTLLNIDMMIIEELEPLFMGVW